MNDILTLAGLAAVVCAIAGLVVIALWLRKWRRELNAEMQRLRVVTERSMALVKKETSAAIESATEELFAAVGLTAIGFSYPVMLGGSSIDGHHARSLLFLLQHRKPRRIIELGSGGSTVLIAKALQKLGRPAELHIAVDHDARFLEATRELARLNGVEQLVRFEHCPLEERAEWAHPWYSRISEVVAGSMFDLILVDGPPAYEAGMERAREPALDVLASYLAPGAIVLLDDANRPGERAVAEAWRSRHPAFEYVHSGKGKGLLTISTRRA